MDTFSTAGIALALVALIGGSILKGAGAGALVNPAAFVIVVVGTFASILVQTPKDTFMRAMSIIKWVFKPPIENTDTLIAKMVEWSETARKQGLLGLEPAIDKEDDEFSKKALQMLVDGTEPEKMRETLELELDAKEKANNQAAKVFEGMGIYAPTLGIIGAVLGLIAVMKNLADPSQLGHGIAAAFTATIYGIGMANLFLLPMANKLKEIIKAQSRTKQMVLEGIIAIAEGENPRNLEVKLKSYVA